MSVPVLPLSEAEVRRGPGAVIARYAPALLDAYDALGASLARGRLEPTLKELVRIRSARLTGCRY